MKDLEKIEWKSSFLSLAARLEPGEMGIEDLSTNSLFSDRRLSKRELVAPLTRQIYAGLDRKGQMRFDGSANSIVPALAIKPYGTCPWQELENELASLIRPPTFAQKVRDLTLTYATVFVIQGTGNERTLVMPEEGLPVVRKQFALPPRLPAETAENFGKRLSPRELTPFLDQIPTFSLRSPSPREIFEVSLVKNSGKKGTVFIPTTATFRELHHVLQEFAGWDDEHLHEFRVKMIDPEPNTIVVDGLGPDGEPIETMRPGDFREDQVQLGQLLSGKNNSVLYVYDFGERRQVKVKVLRVLPRGDDTAGPKIQQSKIRTVRSLPNHRSQKRRGE